MSVVIVPTRPPASFDYITMYRPSGSCKIVEVLSSRPVSTTEAADILLSYAEGRTAHHPTDICAMALSLGNDAQQARAQALLEEIHQSSSTNDVDAPNKTKVIEETSVDVVEDKEPVSTELATPSSPARLHDEDESPTQAPATNSTTPTEAPASTLSKAERKAERKRKRQEKEEKRAKKAAKKAKKEAKRAKVKTEDDVSD